VRAVAQRLRIVAQRVGVLEGSLRSSPATAARHDLLRRPVIDGVGSRLDLEHPVRRYSPHARRLQPGAPRGPFERLETRGGPRRRSRRRSRGRSAPRSARPRPCGAISETHPLARWRTIRTSSSALWPAASAVTVSREPGSTVTRARSVPVRRDQPPVGLRNRVLAPELQNRNPASASPSPACPEDLGRVDHERDAAVLARGAAAPATA